MPKFRLLIIRDIRMGTWKFLYNGGSPPYESARGLGHSRKLRACGVSPKTRAREMRRIVQSQ